tara:strand:+ start:2068 stop:2241 length:174 start_codon:yes stop_codon:yes gene_type:complete
MFWKKPQPPASTHERRMEQMKHNPYKRVDSECMTERQKMDEGFNGRTFTINGIEVDF